MGDRTSDWAIPTWNLQYCRDWRILGSRGILRLADYCKTALAAFAVGHLTCILRAGTFNFSLIDWRSHLSPLPERIGLKPQARSGEIKRRLFITPILFLPGRGRYLAVNCQLNDTATSRNPRRLTRTTCQRQLSSPVPIIRASPYNTKSYRGGKINIIFRIYYCNSVREAGLAGFTPKIGK